jgi:putative sigma-54 modulation protein
MEIALREAIAKVETQAIRYKDRLRARKRKPKEEKLAEDSQLARTRRTGRAIALAAGASLAESPAQPSTRATNGNGRTKPPAPVTVHSFPARTPIAEPHVVRSIDSIAMRPMSLEEAVKEAEFRDREVFVFRDNQGGLKVLHRKRDGKMELIEVP